MRRLCIGAAAGGTVPLILVDLRPDYTALVRALGGQVVCLGRGHGSLNVLDAGGLDEAALALGGAEGERLTEEAHGRRLNLLAALLTVVRGSRLTDHELTILSAALRALAVAHHGQLAPLLKHLIALLEARPARSRPSPWTAATSSATATRSTRSCAAWAR